MSLFFLRIRLLLAVLGPLLASPGLGASTVPERPPGYVLDRGQVFTPEVAARLSGELQACAREHDVHIYVVTVPSLAVMPSRVRETIEEFTAATTAAWTEGVIGAVIAFDDEAGWVTVHASAATERKFSDVTLQMLFKEPLTHVQKKGPAAVRLEAASMVLIRGLANLQQQAAREARRHLILRIIFWSLVIGALALGSLGLFRKRPAGDAPGGGGDF